MDIRAKIIYDSRQGDIIDQYIASSRIFDEQIRRHGKTERAVRETLRICKNRDVLKDYLAKELCRNYSYRMRRMNSSVQGGGGRRAGAR